MKRFWCVLLAAVMLFGVYGTALAAAGDQAVLILDGNGMYASGSIGDVFLVGNQVYIFIQGLSEKLLVYDLETGASTEYNLQEALDGMNGYLNAAEDAVPEAPAEAGGEEMTEGVQMGSVACWFPIDGEFYAVVNYSTTSQERTTIDGGHVRKLTLNEGKATLAEEDTLRLDWSNMTETSGSWVSSKYISTAAASGGKLYTQTYDNYTGNPLLVIFDLATGAAREVEIQEINGFSAMEDGKLLMDQYVWGEQTFLVLNIYDPDSDSTQELARFEMDSGNISSIAYDPGTDMLYYTKNGEIYATQGQNSDQATAAAVNDNPVSGREFARITPDGRLLVWSYEAVFLRNLDPSQRSETILRVRPFTWTSGLQNASFQFAAEHPEIEIVTESYGNADTLLQAMMNRDGAVDIYLIDLGSSAFNAILDRGFFADLNADAALSAEIDKMYPFVRESLERNGKLAAIPVEISGQCFGYNPEVLKKLNMTEEDLPKTWNEFFDFLQEIPERLRGTGFRAFEMYTYREDMTLSIMNQVLNQYSISRPDAALNTQELRDLLEKAQKIDFDALEILTEEDFDRLEQESNLYEQMGGMKEPLLTTYAEMQMSTYNANMPLTISLEAGENAVLPVSMSVAFVNPYSEHQEEAMAFLRSILGSLAKDVQYTFYPDLNEPLRYPNHEEQKAYMQKWLAQAKGNMEKAVDEATRHSWEEIVAEYEKSLAEFDETNWMISPEAIAKYRARAEYLKPMTWDFYSAIMSAEGTDQFWDLRRGFGQGTTTAAEFLTYMDKKIQMMRLEGN